jgi:hypothetical protein
MKRILWFALLGGLALGAAPSERFPNIPADYLREAERIPGFWVSTLADVNRFLDTQVHRGTVATIGKSAGGREIRAVFYGRPRQETGTTTFSGSLSYGDFRAYTGPDASARVYMGLAGVHGGEFEAMVGTVNLIAVLETGKDLRGRAWPEITAVAKQLERIILIPVANPDGRARVPLRMEAPRGSDFTVSEYFNTGAWADGHDIGWPDCKQYIPLDFSRTQFPGGYPNDNGVNFQHDDFLGHRQPETEALLELTGRERPDLILNLHTGAVFPVMHRPYIEPALTPAFDELYRRVMTRLAKENLEATADPKAEADPAEAPMGTYNLNTALNLHSGALAAVFESPSHATSTAVRDGKPLFFTPDQLLDTQLFLHLETMKYLAETGGRHRWLPAKRAAAKLSYHDARTDASGRIAPWYGSGPEEAYDHVVRLVWDFWKNMRKCPNGLPYYMQHQVWKPDQEDARGLGGDQIPMALSSWNLLYGYLGDKSIHENMRFMADTWLERGMSASNLRWPNSPYPYNTELHSGRYDGDMRAGKGFLQPDKAASFAAELIVLFKITGERKYLDAAVRIADTLAAKAAPGDGENSPWPYRVNAATGEVHREVKDGKTSVASYTTNYTGALRMFDDLIAIKQGNTAAYAKARALVAAWLKTYPLRTNKWGPFFEDIPTSAYSDTEINADTLAMYILEHPEWDAQGHAQAKAILDWSYRTFANKDYVKWGVVPIHEQTVYMVPGNSHTSRHAAVELLYCARTGDDSLKEGAIRRLNWATYTVDTDGKNRYPNDDNWLTDGYGDYVRHYLRAMAAAPELAPTSQNHLLETTSVIQSVEYGPEQIRYRKFDAQSTERFKLGAWVPKSVEGGTMQWDAKTRVLTVKATGQAVVIAKR